MKPITPKEGEHPLATSKRRIRLGFAVLALATIVATWPAPRVDIRPVLERRLQHPTESVAPLERPDRPPHPASIYMPPGR